MPLSLDEQLETLRRHIRSKGWDNLPHYWLGEQDALRRAQALGPSVPRLSHPMMQPSENAFALR